jgi:hypothetical protein
MGRVNWLIDFFSTTLLAASQEFLAATPFPAASSMLKWDFHQITFTET